MTAKHHAPFSPADDMFGNGWTLEVCRREGEYQIELARHISPAYGLDFIHQCVKEKFPGLPPEEVVEYRNIPQGPQLAITEPFIVEFMRQLDDRRAPYSHKVPIKIDDSAVRPAQCELPLGEEHRRARQMALKGLARFLAKHGINERRVTVCKEDSLAPGDDTGNARRVARVLAAIEVANQPQNQQPGR